MINQQSANSRFLFIILFIIFQNSFSFAQDGSQFVRIHTVPDITTMNNTILPARGNLIYVQPEEQIYYYDGSSWQPISSITSTSDWALEGNSIISNQFIGTTNNEDFRIRSNDTLRMIVKADGKVGINNDNPTGAFQVTTGGGLSSDLTIANNSNISGQIWNGINLVDDDLTTYGGYINLSGFFIYGFDTPTLITSYNITCDGNSYPIKSFLLQARNGNDSWTTIDTRSNISWTGLEAKEFLIPNTNTANYEFYRIYPTDAYDTGDDWRIYEVEMFSSAENSHFIVTTDGDVGIGTDTPTEKLHVMGNVLASGTITPDYVFEHYFDGKSELNPNYKFMTLEKSIEYAKKNKHLPGVSSSKEIQDQGGILINKAVEQNLEKIEELYLHLYELQQEIKSLKERKIKSD